MSKKTAWILLPAVLLIWGLLAWKIYAAMKDDSDAPFVADAPTLSTSQHTTIPDTYQLLLDYPDPFLTAKKTPVRNAASPKPKSTAAPAANITPVPSPTWPELRYAGLVQSHGKTLGFLSVNGESHFVKTNDVIDDLTVQKIWKDSVLVMRGKEKKVVRK
jgi:hypothetical protein